MEDPIFHENFQKQRISKQNFKIFIYANMLMSLAVGLFGPFYVLFVRDFGGSLENFGIAMGLVVFSGSLVYLFAGKYSNKYGQKLFLIFAGYASAIIVFLYTIINHIWQLYLLQIVSGLIVAVFKISETAYLGNNTQNQTRGEKMGVYFAFAGFIEAIAIFGSIFLIRWYGFEIVFYIVSIIFLVATIILFKLKNK